MRFQVLITLSRQAIGRGSRILTRTHLKTDQKARLSHIVEIVDAFLGNVQPDSIRSYRICHRSVIIIQRTRTNTLINDDEQLLPAYPQLLTHFDAWKRTSVRIRSVQGHE